MTLLTGAVITVVVVAAALLAPWKSEFMHLRAGASMSAEQQAQRDTLVAALDGFLKCVADTEKHAPCTAETASVRDALKTAEPPAYDYYATSTFNVGQLGERLVFSSEQCSPGMVKGNVVYANLIEDNGREQLIGQFYDKSGRSADSFCVVAMYLPIVDFERLSVELTDESRLNPRWQAMNRKVR